MKRALLTSIPLTIALFAAACGGADPAGGLPAPPALDTSTMEPLVAETLGAARAAVIADPEDAQRWSELGLALDAHFFLEEAEQCLAVAIQLDPTIFRAVYDHAVLGTMLERSVDDVAARFERAGALRDDYPPIHARLGDFLLVSGDAEGSLAAFERAREVSAGLDYEYDYAELGIGRALLDQGETEAAVERLSRLHERFPGDPALATALGQGLTMLQRVDEAAAVTARQRATEEAKVQLGDSVRRDIMTRSRSAAMNFQRGEAMVRRREFAAAAVEFQRVLTVDEDNRTARLYLASALMELRRIPESRAQLDAVLEASPGDLDAHRMLGLLDAESGAFEEADRHFKTVTRSAPLDHLGYQAWVTALGSMNRWDEALFRIEQWRTASPTLAEPAYLRAMALFNADRREEAVEALEAAKALAPGHPMRPQAERILAR
ncbi:MAG: tetratricopeptide repeat protein [Planctomycetes bacterium]|nr:tetratricopeptide repeat protein [Planctomycetota bacterium]